MSAQHACSIPTCKDRTPGLMCPRHWRMVPPEVKRIWRVAWLTYNRTREDAIAMLENRAEIVRIVQAIEAGVPA